MGSLKSLETRSSTGFVLDALEQALHARRPAEGGLVYHSDRGVQYVSIKQRAARQNGHRAFGSAASGDSYDNALAETVIGLFKTEVIHRRGPLRSFDAVEYATLEMCALARNQPILSINNFAFRIHPEALSDGLSGTIWHLARLKIDRFACEPTLGFG